MPKPSRLLSVKDDILAHFSGAPKSVYSKFELTQILARHRHQWHLAEHTSGADFIAFLVKHGQLRMRKLHSQNYNSEIVRYSREKASVYQLALSIRPRSYLSHGTAAVLHGLTNFDRNTIHLNAEQSAKPPHEAELSQEGINRAFAARQRESNLIYTNGRNSVVQLAGKNTNRLGVEKVHKGTEALDVTCLERTLVDIVVRPTYAGGPSNVFRAYQAAKSAIAIDRFITILEKLNYAYPYHQAVGFLMQHAGYSETICARLRAFGLKYDFHLSHGVREAEYSNEWRIFYPKGLISQTL